MPFTGKATYTAGADLPEIVEDVADILSIVSPYETPLLDHLGDPARGATSTIHEWLEDSLLPNSDVIASAGGDPFAGTALTMEHGDRFRVGDQIQAEGQVEVMLVTAVAGDTVTVVRGYGGTAAAALADGDAVRILGNAALEGDDAPAARFTSRVRRSNATQIFTAKVEVSGSQLAARRHAVADELDYQKQERLRELVRDLENCVINGVAPAADAQGSATVRRTMRGIIATLQTHRLSPGAGGMPDGDSVGGVTGYLSEELLNAALRAVWEGSAGGVDTIVVGGAQKRRINGFVSGGRAYSAETTRYRDMVSVYESDFGVCRVVLSRWVPRDTVLLLDSSRVDVLPMTGRSFHFKKLASTGDSEAGQLIGEYTLELRNENAHAVLSGLGV